MRWWIFVCIAVFWASCQSAAPADDKADSTQETDTLIITEPELVFGFPKDSFMVHEATMGRNDFLSTILEQHKVDYNTVLAISEASKPVFDVRKFQAGKSYCVLSSKDSIGQCFIYEPNALEYVVYDFRNKDSVTVYLEERPIELRERSASGTITSSLYQSMEEAGASPLLALRMSEVYAWSIDFYRIQKNDKFKVIYDEKVVDGEVVGVGDIKAAWFEHFGDDYYAFWFEKGDQADFFDEEANSLRKAFLKAPVKFSTITSRYTMNRFHPVLKRNKPHLGTDYAAPTGTPIMTTGDGVVIEAGYTRGNGNYVKVRHNGTYTTQYLHMTGFAKGIKKGVRVRQGQTIGYVGSTGLATGPHVCYRFWKNGSQVDPFKEKIPPSEPVKAENKVAFDSVRAYWMQALNQVNIHTELSAR